MSQTSQNPSKLYQYEVCPFCCKVRAGLALKKANFEKIEVHPLNKKELAFSDYKKVPVYIDSHGAQVNDSNVILKHLDEEFPGGPQLAAPEGSDARKEQDKWLEWAERYVKAIPPLIYDTLPNSLKAFDYITKVGKFSALQKMTIKYSGALVMKMVAKRSRARQHITDPREHIQSMISEWTAALGTNPYRGGTSPDITDAAVFGITLSMKGLPAFAGVRQNPVFDAWLSRMSEQTSLALTN